MNRASSADRVPVSALIDAVRRDLLESAEARGGEPSPLFKISEVGIEFSVEARHDDEVSGGLSLYIVNIGGGSSEGVTTTAKVEVRLTALEEKERAVHKDTTDPLIRGT